MNEETVDANPALQEAFAAYVQAQEDGQLDAARRLLRDHPGLAEEVATYYALCTRIPKPWDASVNSYDGRTLGDFELLHELGRGGEGVVYKARQKSLQTVVAVKVMRHERFSLQSDAERFRRDSILLASLDHPNIVRILYAGESETGPYFAMELMADGSLKEKLAKGWLPTPKQAAELVRVLAEAMQCAHDNKIVHRDLKPANIMLQPNGTPKIVDFGLAKKLDAANSMTQAGAIVGTISYMSPEQAKGQRADFACDIYGLGAILYELLTGRPPFVGSDELEMLKQVREIEPLPVRHFSPGVPRDLEVICLKCLAKEPAGRYASAKDLAADLARFLNDEPILGRVPGLTELAFKALLRQQFTNHAAWGWIVLWMSGINGSLYLCQAWSILSDQPHAIYFGIVLLHLLLIAAVIWRGLRGCRLETADCQTIAFWVATIGGALLMPQFHPHHADLDRIAYRLSLFPLMALLQAALLVVQGAIFWGGFYLCGVGYVILGFVMARWPQSSPFLFGLYAVAIQVPLGLAW